MKRKLYHGTKFRYVADKILKEGFIEWTYFSKDLNDAIEYGGKYVFEVVFLESDIPDNWQVRCKTKIPPERIVAFTKYVKTKIYYNRKLNSEIFALAMKKPEQIPYSICFEEKY